MSPRKTFSLRFFFLAAGPFLLGVPAVHLAAAEAASQKPVLARSEVVFMYAAGTEAYRSYGATFVAWGGAETKEEVKRHRDLGIRCTGSMWCLTAGPKLLHESPELRAAVAVDIEGKPAEGRVVIESPKGTLAVARRSAGGAVVLHVLNLDYDASSKRLRPASSVSVALPASLPGSKVSRARLLSYDAEPATVPLVTGGDKLRLELPQLRIWILAALE
jgi:hypothetical protein